MPKLGDFVETGVKDIVVRQNYDKEVGIASDKRECSIYWNKMDTKKIIAKLKEVTELM